MATPIPKASPASTGTAGIVGVLLVFLLTGGEYYYLTLKDELRLYANPKISTQLPVTT